MLTDDAIEDLGWLGQWRKPHSVRGRFVEAKCSLLNNCSFQLAPRRDETHSSKIKRRLVYAKHTFFVEMLSRPHETTTFGRHTMPSRAWLVAARPKSEPSIPNPRSRPEKNASRAGKTHIDFGDQHAPRFCLASFCAQVRYLRACGLKTLVPTAQKVTPKI